MPEQAPFHSRTEPLNQTKIWKHWSGYLVAPKYLDAGVVEYYSVRNSVGLLDTTPLFKYRFAGPDAESTAVTSRFPEPDSRAILVTKSGSGQVMRKLSGTRSGRQAKVTILRRSERQR